MLQLIFLPCLRDCKPCVFVPSKANISYDWMFLLYQRAPHPLYFTQCPLYYICEVVKSTYETIHYTTAWEWELIKLVISLHLHLPTICDVLLAKS